MALATNGTPRNPASDRSWPSWSRSAPAIDVSRSAPGSGPCAAAASSSPLADASPAGPRTLSGAGARRPLVLTRRTSTTAAASMISARITWARLIVVGSVELDPRVGRHLLQPHAAGLDVGLGVILALHLVAREPPQHGQLPGVRERVGDPALEYAARLPRDRGAGGEVLVS